MFCEQACLYSGFCLHSIVQSDNLAGSVTREPLSLRDPVWSGQWWGPESRFVSFVPLRWKIVLHKLSMEREIRQPCIMDGAKSTLFLVCSSHCVAVQCIVCFTVLVRANKVWYNWQHCSPKCKIVSRHTTKAFMIKGIVQNAYFIKQNISLLGKK